MNSHLSQPIYIHGCGFHSALGATAEQIHHALQHNHSVQMQQAVDQLNTGTATIVGRASDTLPELPSSLREYDSRNNRLALSALQQIEPAIQEAIRQYGANRIAVVIAPAPPVLPTAKTHLSRSCHKSTSRVIITTANKSLATSATLSPITFS